MCVFAKYFGSDDFGLKIRIREGSSSIEPRITNRNDPRYIAGLTDIPNHGPGTRGYSPARDIILEFPTFTSFSDMAGISRIYGGIHYKWDNEEGQRLGKMVCDRVWKRFRELVK
jgi:hypothetical protein